ncbi:MAG: hypothetical protein ACERKV_07600 [Clostridiaceae bacterium]
MFSSPCGAVLKFVPFELKETFNENIFKDVFLWTSCMIDRNII